MEIEPVDEEPDDEKAPPKGFTLARFDEFEHDPFIDDIKGRIWEYPQDAP